MKKDFIFPKGVRFPSEEEVPNREDKKSIINGYKNVKIKVGYILTETKNDDYKYYAEINVSSPDIWDVFEKLSKDLIPELSAPILGIKDQEDELYYGPYANRDNLLNIFSNFKLELSNDGFIQFGLIHQVNKVTEEIFVNPSKHFSVWTDKKDKFLNVMEFFEISEYEELKFIDEYPRTTLFTYEGMERNHNEVIAELKKGFSTLENKQ